MLLFKITNIKDFKEVIVYWYNQMVEHNNHCHEEFLAFLIEEVIIDHIFTSQKDLERLNKLTTSIRSFLQEYDGAEEEWETIDKFEKDAEKFLDVYKDQFPIYVALNCNGDDWSETDIRRWQLEVYSESELRYSNINQIKENFNF